MPEHEVALAPSAAIAGDVLDPTGLALRAAEVTARQRSPETRRTYAAVYRAFGAIPSLPGAIVVKTMTFGETAPDTSEGPIVGWTTSRELRFTRRRRGEQVIARVLRDLHRSGWQVDGATDSYLYARRDRSCLHLVTTADARTARDAPQPSAPAPEGPTETPSPPAEPEPRNVEVRGLLLSVSNC